MSNTMSNTKSILNDNVVGFTDSKSKQSHPKIKTTESIERYLNQEWSEIIPTIAKYSLIFSTTLFVIINERRSHKGVHSQYDL